MKLVLLLFGYCVLTTYANEFDKDVSFEEGMILMQSGSMEIDNFRVGPYTAFLGLSGSGKSTTIQLLTDNNPHLQAIKVQGVLKFTDNNTKIGDNHFKSMTLIPELEIDKDHGKDIFLIDFPGFDDTRGPNVDISINYFIQKVLNKASSLRLVFVIDYQTFLLHGDRNQFIRTLQFFVQFIKNVDKYKDSIVFVVTKAPYYFDDQQLTQNIQEFLNTPSLLQRLEDDSEPSLLNNALKMLAIMNTTASDSQEFTKLVFTPRTRNVGLVNSLPEMKEGRTKMRRVIFNTNFTKNNPDDFQFSLSLESKTQIMNKYSVEIFQRISHILSDMKTNWARRIHDKCNQSEISLLKYLQSEYLTLQQILQTQDHYKIVLDFKDLYTSKIKETHLVQLLIFNLDYVDFFRKYIDSFPQIDVSQILDTFNLLKSEIGGFCMARILNTYNTLLNTSLTQMFDLLIDNVSKQCNESTQLDTVTSFKNLLYSYNSLDKVPTFMSQMKDLIHAKTLINENEILILGTQLKNAESPTLCPIKSTIQHDIENTYNNNSLESERTFVSTDKCDNVTYTISFLQACCNLNLNEKLYNINETFSIMRNDIDLLINWYKLLKSLQSWLIQDTVQSGKKYLLNKYGNNELKNEELFLTLLQRIYFEEPLYSSPIVYNIMTMKMDQILKHYLYTEVECSDGNILTIKGAIIYLSNIYNTDCWSSAIAIRLFAFDSIQMDTSLNFYARELQLTLISPVWYVKHNVTIILDGKNGYKYNSAPTRFVDYRVHRHGKDGDSGGPAGSVIAIVNEIQHGERLTVSAIGGNGGDGQNGRQGTDGTDGGRNIRPGDDAYWTCPSPTDNIYQRKRLSGETEHIQIFRSYAYRIQYPHAIGSKGEDGGNGGAAGRKGIAGTIQCITSRGRKCSSFNQILKDGNDGEPGLGGLGGKGGKSTALHMTCSAGFGRLTWTLDSTETTKESDGRQGSNGVQASMNPIQARPRKPFLPTRVTSLQDYNIFAMQAICSSKSNLASFYNDLKYIVFAK